MTDLKQAMLQAVDALGSNNPDIQLRAAVTLRAALAAPQPEPVGVLWQHEETGRTDFLPLDEGRVTESRWGRVGPLYLHPPQRQPLTVDELRRQHTKIEQLKAERDALKVDAERYRWLRKADRETLNDGMDNLNAIDTVFVCTGIGEATGFYEEELDFSFYLFLIFWK